MSISSFNEELQQRLDKAFETQANTVFGAIRNFDEKRAIYTTGYSDGLHAAAQLIAETYKIFVTDGNEGDDESARTLY